MKWSLNPCLRYEMEISLLAFDAGNSRSTVSDQPATAVQIHLKECPDCRARFEELRALTQNLEKLDRLPEVAPSEGFQTRWASAITSHAESAPANTHILAWLERFLFSPRAAWGSLAAIWLLVTVFNAATPGGTRPGVVAQASLREIAQTIKTELLANSAAGRKTEPSYSRKPMDVPRIVPPRSQLRIETVIV